MLRILFAISIIALLMLLWASISIAQHIRHARRRRRAAAKKVSEVALLYGEVDTDDDFAGQRSVAPPPPPPSPSTLEKKPERADWAYFKKDLGDLSDPYQERRRKARESSGQQGSQ
jgi:hypothetical protein